MNVSTEGAPWFWTLSLVSHLPCCHSVTKKYSHYGQNKTCLLPTAELQCFIYLHFSIILNIIEISYSEELKYRSPISIVGTHARTHAHTQTHHTQGVFKKRRKFLNSAPTSTESALRLLSAPSARFWLQTAICPVSLWALFVALHPLNWTRAKDFRRISDKVTMKELEECGCMCVWNFAANLVKIYRGISIA
jgi:hypothetical protein